MKKSIIGMIIMVALLITSIGVYAAELSYEGYEDVPEVKQELLDERIVIVNEAVREGTLTEDEGKTMIDHIIEMFISTDNGRSGQRNSQNEECILSEDGPLNLFSGAANGQRAGGSETRGNSNGSRGANKGLGVNNDGICVLED